MPATVLAGPVVIEDISAGVQTNNVKADILSALPAGSNVIGKVDINSALPTGANTIGSVKLTDGSVTVGIEDTDRLKVTARDVHDIVPSTFTKQITSGSSFTVIKGNLNRFRLYPQIRDEYVEEAGDIVGTIATGLIVGQIFKASYDNINTLELTLKSGATATVIDNIEGYASDAALQAVWVESGNKAVRESTIISPNNSSTQSMKIDLDSNGDEWVKTISLIDLTETVFNLDYYQTKEFNKAKVSLFISDGTNSKSIQLSVANKDVWQSFTLSEEAMIEDGVGITNSAAITKIGFRVDDKDGDEFGYIDNISYQPKPGHIDIKLWDMGSSLPISGTTKLIDGTQYAQLTYNKNVDYIRLGLLPGKRRYLVREFLAGLHGGTAITVDNYYIISLHYVDQDTIVYGDAGGNNLYNNGFGFTTTGESVAITTMGTGNDCFFSLFHTQDVYLTKVIAGTHNRIAGPASDITILLESTGEVINETIMTNVPLVSELGVDIDLVHTPAYLPNKGKLEIYYNDDETDNVADINIAATYLYASASPNL